MHRRNLLVALAGAAAASTLADSGFAAPMAAMTAADLTHAKRTAAIGKIALETAGIALQKARTARVVEFAKFEHDEQTTVAEILKSMDPQLTPAPDRAMLATVQQLAAMPAGPAFEKTFVLGQIEGHEMLLKIQNDYLAVAKNPAGTYVTMLVRGMIKQHLALLADLQKGLG